MTRICLLIGFSIVSSVVYAGDPALPGHHPLSQTQAGSVLIAELRCAACHSGSGHSAVPEKTAPDLSQAGTRISPDFLKRFLASPGTAHPGTTMPDLLGSRSEAERQQIAEALTHFLIAQSKSAQAKSAPSKSDQPSELLETVEPANGSIDRQQGKDLFHTVGCVACHGPKEPQPDTLLNSTSGEEQDDEDPALAARRMIKPIAVPLGHVASKYSIKSLGEFLFQPLKVRSSGRMPDMKLTPAESLAIAEYLIGEQPPAFDVLSPDAALVEQGKKHFQDLNCAACHALPGIPAAQLIGSLKTADLARGCLAKSTESNANVRNPVFDLNANQVTAITAAIRADSSAEPESDRVELAKTLTAFRCVACHVRDDYGGVHDDHNSFFVGSEVKLGDDGRIPPPLTLMGAKLQPNWLKKVLFDGESVRHYMATRMPQYGSRNLPHLPELFRRLDELSGPEMKLPSPESRDESEREREKVLRAAGRELLGDKGVNCVSCHTFNGKAAQLNQGIDLLTSYERLQPAWFNSYLKNPGAYRPRTVMPTAWPGGRAVFTKILDGDTDRQIEAIWYYLSLGTSAADPSGVRAVNTKLVVDDQAVIHRGRSRVAGFRGIAVGLPQRINYAFNAETGTLTAIWQGDFINVNWSGQGSGDFHPASEFISLAQDVSFVALPDEEAPWPLLPVMTKESRVNPNPLYPKNVGYQFRGYYLDESMIPTFQYSSGTLNIEDRLDAVGDDGRQRLLRVLQFESAAAQTVWFRALVGEIVRESDQIYRSGQLKLTAPTTDVKLRPLAGDSKQGDSKQSELLLQLRIPQGKSTLEFQYEPLRK